MRENAALRVAALRKRYRDFEALAGVAAYRLVQVRTAP